MEKLDLKAVFLQINMKMVKDLDKLAYELGVTRSSLIKMILYEYLKNIKKEGE